MSILIDEIEYLSPTEAAQFVNLSHWTIRKWLTARKLPRFHLGGRVYIKKTDLEALMQPNDTHEKA